MVWPKKLWEGIASDILDHVEIDHGASSRRGRSRRPTAPYGADRYDMEGPPDRGSPPPYDHVPPPSSTSRRGISYRDSDDRMPYPPLPRGGSSHSPAGYRQGRDEGFPSMSDLGSALPSHRTRGGPPSPGYGGYGGGSPSPPPFEHGGGGRYGGGPSSRSSFGGPSGPLGGSRGPLPGTYENPLAYHQVQTSLGGGGRYPRLSANGGGDGASEYGGPSYGGGPHGGRSPYGGRSTIGGPSPYGESSTYGGRSTYAGGSTYVGESSHGGGSIYRGSSTYEDSEFGGPSNDDEPIMHEIRPRGYGGSSSRRERSRTTRAPSRHDYGGYDSYSPPGSYRSRSRTTSPAVNVRYEVRVPKAYRSASSARYESRQRSYPSSASPYSRSASSRPGSDTSSAPRYPSPPPAFHSRTRRHGHRHYATEPPSPEYEIREPKGYRSPSPFSSSRSPSPASTRSPSPTRSPNPTPAPSPPPTSLPPSAIRDLLVGRTFCHWPDFRLADIFERKYPAQRALHDHASLAELFLRLEREKGPEWKRWATEGGVEEKEKEKKVVHRELHTDGERWGDGQVLLDGIGWACRRCAEEGGTYRRVLSEG